MISERPYSVLIVGATSAIAEHAARRWAERGAILLLAGRDEVCLEVIRRDLIVRGAADARIVTLDFTDRAAVRDRLLPALALVSPVDVILVAHGIMPSQEECERTPDLAVQVLQVNAASVIGLCLDSIAVLRAQGRGTLAVCCSMAGERGRRQNFVYGASKAAVAIFLEGLRGEVAHAGVNVCTLKLGPVDTPMTANHRKSVLFTSAARAADGIVRAIDGGAAVAYVPRFWGAIAFVLRILPERIVSRLKA